jgi:EAL domain-containing protein (putative c-di-GMP-specific phosphodiesterase class I)
MSLRHRLLGLAFASSDLLVEITSDGTVAFALGAGPSVAVKPERLKGQPLEQLFLRRDGSEPLKPLKSLKPGARLAPIEVLIACGDGRARRASLSAFVLPELAPNISCSIRYDGPAFSMAATDDAEAMGVLDADAFVDRARSALSAGDAGSLAVSFIDIAGLTASGAQGERATARIEAALRSASVDGSSASRITDDRYALLRDQADTRDIVGEVGELARDEGLSLMVTSSESSLSKAAPVNVLRALRFAIQSCLNDEQSPERPDEAFNSALSRTLQEADQFRIMVRDREFALHYQPIVALESGAVHHFEALARFGGTGYGPGPVIQMAEELALIEGFDLAVAEKVTRRLRQPGAGLLKIALNVSGASLASDIYVQQLLQMTATTPEVRKRLIVEVTESAALADIEAANRRLGALRGAGIKLCIDDFGAGAASFDYLHGLSVDAVKIDGKFVRGMETDIRSRTLIAHLVDLCGSLNLTTIAEFVETQASADLLRSLGVNYGQGWLFGKAEAEPRTVLNSVAPARRRGAVEAWG